MYNGNTKMNHLKFTIFLKPENKNLFFFSYRTTLILISFCFSGWTEIKQPLKTNWLSELWSILSRRSVRHKRSHASAKTHVRRRGHAWRERIWRRLTRHPVKRSNDCSLPEPKPSVCGFSSANANRYNWSLGLGMRWCTIFATTTTSRMQTPSRSTTTPIVIVGLRINHNPAIASPHRQNTSFIDRAIILITSHDLVLYPELYFLVGIKTLRQSCVLIFRSDAI